jgi:hypothetical protein
MKLKCYAIDEFPPALAPARSKRDWMESFVDRHPYRCLPLAIANASGWEILCPVPIEIDWSGGNDASALSIRALKPLPSGREIKQFCTSNFTRGIVTFHTGYIFVTDPDWNLIATGPFNEPHDNAFPLTGTIETDWLPYPFTMNWQILRPGRVIFEEGQPFCLIFPVAKRALMDCEVEIFELSDNPVLEQNYLAFRSSRQDFMTRFKAGDQETIQQAWQKHYFRGRHPDGRIAKAHVSKLKMRKITDHRSNSR